MQHKGVYKDERSDSRRRCSDLMRSRPRKGFLGRGAERPLPSCFTRQAWRVTLGVTLALLGKFCFVLDNGTLSGTMYLSGGNSPPKTPVSGELV